MFCITFFALFSSISLEFERRELDARCLLLFCSCSLEGSRGEGKIMLKESRACVAKVSLAAFTHFEAGGMEQSSNK